MEPDPRHPCHHAGRSVHTRENISSSHSERGGAAARTYEFFKDGKHSNLSS